MEVRRKFEPLLAETITVWRLSGGARLRRSLRELAMAGPILKACYRQITCRANAGANDKSLGSLLRRNERENKSNAYVGSKRANCGIALSVLLVPILMFSAGSHAEDKIPTTSTVKVGCPWPRKQGERCEPPSISYLRDPFLHFLRPDGGAGGVPSRGDESPRVS